MRPESGEGFLQRGSEPPPHQFGSLESQRGSGWGGHTKSPKTRLVAFLPRQSWILGELSPPSSHAYAYEQRLIDSKLNSLHRVEAIQ